MTDRASECVWTTTVPMFLCRQLFHRQSKSPTRVIIRVSSTHPPHSILILCTPRKQGKCHTHTHTSPEFPIPGRMKKECFVQLWVCVPACLWISVRSWECEDLVSTSWCRLFYCIGGLGSDLVTAEGDLGRAEATFGILATHQTSVHSCPFFAWPTPSHLWVSTQTSLPLDKFPDSQGRSWSNVRNQRRRVEPMHLRNPGAWKSPAL